MMQFTEDLRSVEATDEERTAIGVVNEALAHAAVAEHAPAYLIGPNNEHLVLPESLFRVLRKAAILLSKGDRVVLAPVNKEISTQDAADLLGVSRPYLIELLDRGEIAFGKTGRYRRVLFGDVLEYKEKRNRERRQRIGEMIRENYTSGMYDREDSEFPETR